MSGDVEGNGMATGVQIAIDDRRAELKAVLGSREFSRAPALAKLLAYLCEKTFDGKVHEIKEFSIATEVYGRDLSFGEKRDSVVRVEVSRLRKRLRTYYEQEGSGHALRIAIPAGTYEPEFELVGAPAAVAGVGGSEGQGVAVGLDRRRVVDGCVGGGQPGGDAVEIAGGGRDSGRRCEDARLRRRAAAGARTRCGFWRGPRCRGRWTGSGWNGRATGTFRGASRIAGRSAARRWGRRRG